MLSYDYLRKLKGFGGLHRRHFENLSKFQLIQKILHKTIEEFKFIELKLLSLRYKIDALLDMDARQIYPPITEFAKYVIENRLVCKPGVVVPETIIAQLRSLNETLHAHPYLADDAISLADLAVLVSITQLELVNFDFTGFPYLDAWIKRMKNMSAFHRFNKPFVDYKAYLAGLEHL